MTHLNRRNVVKLAGSLPALGTLPGHAAAARIVAVMDNDLGAPVAWALDQLRQALGGNSGVLELVPMTSVHGASLAIVIAGAASPLSAGFARARKTRAPEQFRLVSGTLSGVPALLVAAGDTRGFVYALLELAERVRFGGAVALHLNHDVEEAPANRVRSVARAFCSEIDDKPWFYSQEFWRGYLSMLAACRFNRFNFFLGIGYDFPRGVTGDYFHFPYPYLVTVPGYDVHVAPALAEGERERNLAMLQFIARETVARGLDFQLGIWTHAYQWTDSPNSDHRITGLTPQTHAPYCREALAMILKACPEISGLTMRIHGESGIPEGSYPFWQTVFDAIPAAGRPIEIDMHAKGLDQTMIDMAVKTGMPVKAGAKFSAEHQSLGYHQADIRPVEIPHGAATNAVFALSEGDRRFTRYGYADLYRADQKYELQYRLWPGTQRYLLWGDPAQAAAFGRSAHFCNAAGFELMEPLTFKGREGSGHGDGRCAYADKSLDPGIDDWKKFEPGYRLWGRLLYNPEATPEAWRRDFSRRYGTAASSAEAALSHASRILPLMTSAHLPSASNHDLDYEMAMNMPIVAGVDTPYTDTPDPKVYGHASPLDPQLFSTIAEHADDLMAGRNNAKYSPREVAAWLDGLAAASQKALAEGRAKAGSNVDFRRLDEDSRIVTGMGRFYAAKLRAALLYEIWQKSHDPKAGALALAQYEKGRAAWAAMAERATRVYVADVSYGRIPKRRGHWTDRLAGIDKDIAAMRASLQAGGAGDAAPAIAKAMAVYKRPSVSCHHVVPDSFHAGAALPLSLGAGEGISVTLLYRHVNHAERWRSVAMQRAGGQFTAAIPADYTHSPFPLQYYFELSRPDAAWLYPAFNATLSNQPYYAVWKRH